MKGFPDLPPIWWVGSIGLIYLCKFAWPDWHFPMLALTVVSWIFFGAAMGILIWAGVWFFKKKTPIEPHHTPKKLIVEGPYRLSRNPIYLALVVLTVGSALGHGSVFGLVIAALLWNILDRRFAEPEEALLRKVFGEDAKAYLQSTRRWI